MVSCPNCDATAVGGMIYGYGTVEVTVWLRLAQDGEVHEASTESAIEDLTAQLGNVAVRGYTCDACEHEWGLGSV